MSSAESSRRSPIAIWISLAIGFLTPAASAQDAWQEHQDPYGTFTVSHPADWQVQQNRPGEVEVKESPNTWVRIAMLATHRGEGATANEEVVSYMYTLPEIPKLRSFSQLSLHPDRAVWSCEIPESEAGKLKGVAAVEVDGVMHYGVAYQSPQHQWRQKSQMFKRIVASFRFGQFKIPEWIYGGDRKPIPEPVASSYKRCWSTDEDGSLSAEVPNGWESEEGDKRLEFFRRGGPSRMIWRILELTGEKESPEKLVAAAVGAASIDGVGVPEQKITKARLFPPPTKPRPQPEPEPDADEPYEVFNRISFTFQGQGQGGATKQGYALVLLSWTKKKPDPYIAEVLVFWTDRDEFNQDALDMEQIAASMYGWEGTYARRDLVSLMKDGSSGR